MMSRMLPTVIILVMIVLLGGCISGKDSMGTISNNTSGGYTNSHSSGSYTNSTNSTNSTSSFTSSTTSQIALSFPHDVTFNVALVIKRGNTTIARYSYNASIDYTRKDAEINRNVVYRPNFKGIAGNWHRERIVIRNGTSFRIFTVPPAAWLPSPKNVSNAIKLALYSRNPYYVLWKFVNSSGVPGESGNYSISLPSNVSRALITAINPEVDVHGDVSLSGTVRVVEGNIVSVNVEGCSGDTRYLVTLEVKKK